MPRYICGGLKYHMLGEPGKEYLCLSTPLQGLPDAIEVEGKKLLLKNEFHVSLYAVGKFIPEAYADGPDFVQRVLDVFCNFVPTNEIALTGLTGEVWLAVRDERATVVAMCEISNLPELTGLFNERFGLAMEVPPAHITLYSLDPDIGISLLNQSDLDQCTKVIPMPEELSDFFQNQAAL